MEVRKKDLLFLGLLIICVTGLHYLTIGKPWAIHDFYRRLYYIPIILGAFKFRLRGGVLVASIISLLYLPHVLLIWGYENIGFINQVLEITMFLFIGSTTGYLVERLYRNNILLSEQLERITEMEILNENILNSMTNALFALNKEKEFKIINHAAKDLYKDIRINTKFNGQIGGIFKYLDQPLDDVIQSKTDYYYDTVRVEKEGVLVVSKVKIYPLMNEKNENMGAVVLIEDITEIHQLEEEIRRAEKLSAVGVMASGVAHEIRNPLGIVKTIAQTIIGSDNLSEVHQEGLGIIIAEVDRANHVIKEILDFTKVEKGELAQENLHDIIKEVVVLTEKYSKDRSVDLEIDVDKNIVLKMDRNKMKQVFINLMMNAVDAMQDGGVVRIQGRIDGPKAIIKVIDTGVGISEDSLDSVFNPFYTTKDKGTGLGLSITHKIIKEHGGCIRVSSKVGLGSEFTIEMPRIEEGEYEI